MAEFWAIVSTALLTAALQPQTRAAQAAEVNWRPTGRMRPSPTGPAAANAAPLEPSVRKPGGPMKLTIPADRTSPAAQLKRLDLIVRRRAQAALKTTEMQKAALAHIEVAQFAIDGIREDLAALCANAPLAAAA